MNSKFLALEAGGESGVPQSLVGCQLPAEIRYQQLLQYIPDTASSQLW